MRTKIKIDTGEFVYDYDLNIEYVYNVEHNDVDIINNLDVTVSSQKGYPTAFSDYNNCTQMELMSEITTAIALSGIREGKRLNVYFAQMGEATFNQDVIYAAARTASLVLPGNVVEFEEYYSDVTTMMPKNNKHLEDFLQEWVNTGFTCGNGFGLRILINTLNETDRNKMFQNTSLSLQKISDIIQRLPIAKRKYNLNFNVTSKSDLNPALMNQFFDKEKCNIMIIPKEDGLDIHEKFERPLVEAGWDVTAFTHPNRITRR